MADEQHDSPAVLSQPPLPPEVDSWPLSRRVRTWREMRGWSVAELAARCDLSITALEEVEAGLERVIPTLMRKRLAKGLQVPSTWLVVGKAPEDALTPSADDTAGPMNLKQVFSIYHEQLPFEAMLANPAGNWPCPECGSMLRVHGYPRETLEGEPLTLIRLNCSGCLFRLEEEVPAHQPDI